MPRINYPADGFGVQSQYYDESILFNGSYQIVSATLVATAQDLTNSPVTTLRAGLLLVKRSDGLYEPLSTADGSLNGDTPTQWMKDVVVLGREFKTTTLTVKNVPMLTPAKETIVPAYWQCNLLNNKYYYNGSETVAITTAQWVSVGGRINLISGFIRKHKRDSGKPRMLPGVQVVSTAP